MSSKKGAKIVVDPAQLDAAKERMQSKLVKGWIGKIESGELGPVKVADALKKVIAETRKFISEGNSPEGGRALPADAAYQLQKYRDALILLNVLEGKDARESASVNRNVGNVAPVLTGRVNAAQSSKKTNRQLKSAAATLTRKVERAQAAAASASARAEALIRGEAVPKKAAAAREVKLPVSPERLARLVASKGRDGDRTKLLDRLLDGIKTDDKTPAYITNTIATLKSQALRFNKAAKGKLMLQISLKIAEIEGQRKLAQDEGKLTKSTAAIYEAKLKALRGLSGAIEEETNVELSNESRLSTTSRKSRVHKRMSCKILRHPCNSKVIVTKEQLKAAVDEIMEKGWATPIAGAASAAPSRLATAAPSAFGSPDEASNE